MSPQVGSAVHTLTLPVLKNNQLILHQVTTQSHSQRGTFKDSKSDEPFPFLLSNLEEESSATVHGEHPLRW